MKNAGLLHLNRRKFLGGAALMALVSVMPVSLHAGVMPERRRKVVLDCDVGIDDAAALLFAHYAKAIDLVGIVSVYGNTTLDQALRNTLYIKEKFHIPAPVYKGAQAPLYHKALEPGVHGKDGLGDSEGIISPSIQAEDLPGAVYLADLIMQHPGEITVITLGASTNLATAKSLRPEIVDHIKEVIVMGGAAAFAGEAGNVTPSAEANVYQDPHAVNLLLREKWPLTMVGLDVTYKAPMDEAYFKLLAKKCGEAGAFLQRISRSYMAFYNKVRNDGYVAHPHDSIAVAYSIAPQLFSTREGKMQVLTDGPAKGHLIFCPKDHYRFHTKEWADVPVHRICDDLDGDAFLDLFMETLANGEKV